MISPPANVSVVNAPVMVAEIRSDTFHAIVVADAAIPGVGVFVTTASGGGRGAGGSSPDRPSTVVADNISRDTGCMVSHVCSALPKTGFAGSRDCDCCRMV